MKVFEFSSESTETSAVTMDSRRLPLSKYELYDPYRRSV